MEQHTIPEALTFDDVLLLPRYSAVLPHEVNVSTRFTRNLKLNIPIVSAAMDTVTGARTAITMARQGGIGIIHKNMSIEDQAMKVEKVKKSESGMIVDPVTCHPDQKISEILNLMSRYRISGVPVIKDGKLVGIVTNRDLRFETNLDQRVGNVMTKDNLITAPEGISLEDSKKILHANRIEKLLVVDDKGTLKGLITIKDIEKIRKYPLSSKDHLGRLRVGAAVGVSPDREARIEALLKAEVDVIVIDTAHGHTKGVMDALRDSKTNFKDFECVAGNVASEEGARGLIDAGADGVKVGIGPGSICTTRIVAGVGVPQISAIFAAVRAAHAAGVPVIADGGVKYSGDITKAIAAGADSVMVGSLFAGTDESPGELILYQGRSYKVYRGMGSIEAMREGSADRYMQRRDAEESKLVPEGIVGRVPDRGPLAQSVYQLVGGLKSGMGYLGCGTIEELHKNARFIRQTAAGLRESHVHDVIITKEAPNYRLE
jgi:IMP dehydrogenase